MRAAKMLKEKRGLSELMSMLILLSLALVAGAIGYGVVTGMSGTLTSKADVVVESSQIVASSTPKMVSVVVKNNGTVGINSCTVSFYDSNGNTENLDLGSISVGQSKAADNTTNKSFEAGKAYTVKLTATAANGSTISQTWSVYAK